MKYINYDYWYPASTPPEEDGWYLVYAPDYKPGSSREQKSVDGKMLSKFKNGKWSIEYISYNQGCVKYWANLLANPQN